MKEKLIAFSECVTYQDRNNAAGHLGISRPTVDSYLAGNVVKVKTAEDLIDFFEGVIKEAKKQIQKAQSA